MNLSVSDIKKFIITYFNALSGTEKTSEMCDAYMTDNVLKEHILFFDTIFPGYELFADEIVVEGDRATVRARITGSHKGEFNGIPPTNKEVELPFAIGYTIKESKIVDHWMIADQLYLMKQLGAEAEV